MKLPRYRTGDAALDNEVAALVERVSDPADLPDGLSRALAEDRPWLLDVAVDPAAPALLPSVSQNLLERA